FARYATINRKKQIGNIDYFDNHSNISIQQIVKTDFDALNKFIIERILSSKNYIQQIINLRFYYEINRKIDIYGYLSTIIHKEDLNAFLIKSNITEQVILDKINYELKIRLLPFDQKHYTNIDTSEFSI